MHNVLILPEVREMLAEGDNEGLRVLITELHPATVADFVEGLTIEETWQLFDRGPIERQAFRQTQLIRPSGCVVEAKGFDPSGDQTGQGRQRKAAGGTVGPP